MDNIIKQDGPDHYSVPKIDAHEAGTFYFNVRKGVGTVRANKYAGKCVKCSVWIEAQAGLLAKAGNKYGVMHAKGGCTGS